MARINTNVASVIAQSNLRTNNADLNVRLERLSTGLRINRGKDDPAGLIISERLRSDIEGVDQAIRNAERASAVIATTEASLAEVNSLLNSIRAMVVEAANTGAFSDEEIAANQLQIDSAIDSITRISNTATFGGLKLLNGSLDYVLSGIALSAISKVNVHGASFISAQNLQVEVDVVGSAQRGALYIRGDHQPLGPNGTFLSSTSLRIVGPSGVTEVDVTASAQYSSLVNTINQRSSLTGVRASLVNPNDASSGMVFSSLEYGSNAFVSVERIDRPADPDDDNFRTYEFANNADIPDLSNGFPWGQIGSLLTESNRDEGRDVSALINGTLASGRGLEISINSPELTFDMLLHEDLAIDPDANSTSFYITGGGALFQLGPEVTAQQQVNLGVPSIASSLLGGTLVDGTLEFLSSLKEGKTNSLRNANERGDFSSLSDILATSIDEVTILRGRLGAFEKNVLETNVRASEAAFENLNSSLSVIRDADFARETSELTRAQILSQAATSTLALANQQSQNVLQLLG